MCVTRSLASMLLFAFYVYASEEFYNLLGVAKYADNKEIRRAFKKLALAKHPDKNKDDPNSHATFMKINRAYEVLKDEDLRKKYDMYGEDGIKDTDKAKKDKDKKFESWDFYNMQFGLYDDDIEIITLSKGDFEQSVEGTDDLWFIKFFGTHCKSCHNMAPVWREVGKELEGVVRIGAVNCEDDWLVCHNEEITSYPTMKIFPKKKVYQGQKKTKALVDYAMMQVRAKVAVLRAYNFDMQIDSEGREKKPWIISFCNEGEECMKAEQLQKLAAMLEDFANVGTMDCATNERLCKKLEVKWGTYYFKPGTVQDGGGTELLAKNVKEIVFKVLEQLPEITVFDNKTFRKAQNDLLTDNSDPWIIHFTETDWENVELRKLPVLLEDINVGRVNCKILRKECDELYIQKFPTFAVFKEGGGHELHTGRHTARDIAAFAKDSAETPMVVLSPEDFPERVVWNGDPWFVDFYAPWCPPCKKLLPEFRKASREMEEVNFGTVDCVKHKDLCKAYSITNYPTTVFYNKSVPWQYHGEPSSYAITEFVRDLSYPPVMSLNSETFDKYLHNKKPDQVWLIDFFSPSCEPCQELAPEWRKISRFMHGMDNFHIAQVDCTRNKELCADENISKHPTIRLYPEGTRDSEEYKTYEAMFRDASRIRSWMFDHLPSKVAKVDANAFRTKVLQATKPWMVNFYAPWCGPCMNFLPVYEQVAQKVERYIKAAKIDCQQFQRTCHSVRLRSYPSIRYYRGSFSQGYSQDPAGEDIIHNALATVEDVLRKLKKKMPKMKIDIPMEANSTSTEDSDKKKKKKGKRDEL